jgi:hypothetical protein
LDGYRFTLESTDGVVDALLDDLDHPQSSGGGAGGDLVPGPFIAQLVYGDPPPPGPIHVGITALSVAIYGTWQASWSPVDGMVNPPAPVATQQSTPLRVLAQPVVLKPRDGITLTLNQVVADGHKTMVVFQYVIDSTFVPLNPSSADTHPLEPVLRLPDGSQVKQISSGPLTLNSDIPNDPGMSTYIASQLIFDPLPENVDHALLVMPQLPGSDPGTVPGNWEIPIELKPAVNPIPVAVVQPGLDAVSDRGITFALEKVSLLPDGYLILGSVQPGDSAFADAGLFAPSTHMTDANGKDVPFEQVIPEEPNQSGRHPWAFQLKGKDFQWPLTIRVNAMQVNIPAQASFQFDPGPAPVPNQVWTLEKDIPIGGYVLHVVGVKHVPALDAFGFSQYQFFMRSTPDLLGASVNDLDRPTGVGMGGGEQGPGVFSAGLFYNGGLPSGLVQVGIRNIYALVHGVWQINWSPPGQ